MGPTGTATANYWPYDTNSTDYYATNIVVSTYYDATDWIAVFYDCWIEWRTLVECHFPMIEFLYALLIYIALRQSDNRLSPYLRRMTVKSTCPPNQRSVRGGRRK